MTDLENLHHDDLCADLASAIEQYGARSLLISFQERYPSHFDEFVAQMNQLYRTKKVAALFKPNAVPM